MEFKTFKWACAFNLRSALLNGCWSKVHQFKRASLEDMHFCTVCRFHDAGYYFWKLSVQCLDLVSTENGEPDFEMLDKFHEYQEKAEIYHLYYSIQRYTVRIDLWGFLFILKLS